MAGGVPVQDALVLPDGVVVPAQVAVGEGQPVAGLHGGFAVVAQQALSVRDQLRATVHDHRGVPDAPQGLVRPDA